MAYLTNDTGKKHGTGYGKYEGMMNFKKNKKTTNKKPDYSAGKLE